MLPLVFDNFFFFIPFFWLSFLFWSFFFFFNTSNVRVKQSLSKDKFMLTDLSFKNTFNFVFFDLVIINFLFLFLFFFSFRGWSCSFFFNTFGLNNTVVYILFIYLLFVCFLFLLLRLLDKFSLNYEFDFFFSIFNFFLVSNFFFLAKSFVSFFFLIEILSCFVFYQFITSTVFYKKVKESTTSSINNFHSKQLLSVLFFQYWASFFSSVIFVYIFSLLIFLFGTTDWFVLNFLFGFSFFDFSNTNTYLFLFLFLLFTFSFFIKLGLSPVQLFKIEIYKGLPFLSIFFYTVFYFFIFFLFFFYLVIAYFTNIWLLIWYVTFFFLVIGGIYALNLMFDTKFVKAFFAYSTVINTLGFLSLFVVILS